MKITDYEIINHGIEHSQYFQGCGTAFTDYHLVSTGIGDSEYDAAQDALEQLYQSGVVTSDELEAECETASKEIDPIIASKDEGNELHVFISIRVKTEKGE